MNIDLDVVKYSDVDFRVQFTLFSCNTNQQDHYRRVLQERKINRTLRAYKFVF